MCLTRGLSYSARGFFQLKIYGVDKFVLLLLNSIPNGRHFSSIKEP